MTAFPSITAVTFDFATNADPLPSPWLANTYSGGTSNLLKALGGVCLKNQTAAAGFGMQVLGTSFGPDMEMWFKVVSLTATNAQEIFANFLRLQQDGAATVDGYVVYAELAAGADTWHIDRIVNGAQTNLANATQNIAAGDFVGAKVEDSGGNPVVTGYWCPAASDPTLVASWTQVLTTTDSNVAKLTGTGRVGLEVQGVVTTFDDMRAGTIVAGSGATVTAVPADGTGDVPDAAASAGSSVTSPAADSTGAIPVPAVSATADAAVTGVPADGTGAIPVPAATGANDSTVTAVPADGTADVPDPAFSAGASVTAVPADATGEIPDDMPFSSSVTTPPASVTGAIPVPSVSGTGGAEVTAVPADGVGDVVTPGVSAGGVVTGVPADGTGDVPDPAASAGATVTSPAGDGTGDVQAPSSGGDSSTTSPPADGGGDVQVPGVTASATVIASPAAAAGDMRAPVLTSGGKIIPRIDLPTTVTLRDTPMTVEMMDPSLTHTMRPVPGVGMQLRPAPILVKVDG